MGYKNLELVKKYPINQISDIRENTEYYVLRGARDIYFISKETMKISYSFSLKLDHEFGYRLLGLNENACYIIIYPVKTPNDKIFGDPNKAYLQSYSTEGLDWSYELNEWSVSRNYGGLFVFDDQVVLTEKRGEEFYTVVIDASTGEVLKSIPAQEYSDHTGSKLGGKQSLQDKIQKKLYHAQNSLGLYEVDLTTFSSELLLSFIPKVMTQNDTHLYCHGFREGKTYFFIIDKKRKEVQKEIVANDFIRVSNMEVSSDNRNLLLIHEDNSLSCFDLSVEEITWRLASDTESSIHQALIDENNVAYIFWKKPTTYINIIDLATGKTLQDINPVKGRFYPPFFLLNNSCFIADFFNIYFFQSINS